MSDTILHPLHTSILPPDKFTYPFCYTPHPLCRLAVRQVEAHISSSGVCEGENGGKMFGVLVVRDGGGELFFLAAYSGLLSGRNDWDYFVPPVFDAQQPDGHFKTTERIISGISLAIADERARADAQRIREAYDRAKASHDERAAQARAAVAEAKRRRDERRRQAVEHGEPMTPGESLAMTRESQHAKAELKRCIKRLDEALATAYRPVEEYEARVATLMAKRREMSDELQKWLFRQYRMLNACGEERDLVEIFSDALGALPPGGAGDCCAPKLLQYAYRHGLRPVCMAEFWWGGSPAQEIRHHMHFYPACRSKCLPILTFMLRGLDVEPNPLLNASHGSLEIAYEDEAIAVVLKPAGMLAVPGKDGLPSVESVMRQRWRQYGKEPIIVHRLDKDTSGLMVVARTPEAYHSLQEQFARRTVGKRYEAVLDGVPRILTGGKPTQYVSAEASRRKGCISLPLAPDIADRPRQRVDIAGGKRAVSQFSIVATDGLRTLVYLYPHTGRTHQLRVHCAHHLGLGCPILGDPLYGRGTTADRMMLHAAELSFCHPTTGKAMTITSDSHFDNVITQQNNTP